VTAALDRRWLLVGLLAISAFASSLNFLLLSPLLKPIAGDLDIADATVGQLATMQALVAATTAVLAAPLIDRYPRGPLLQIEFGILATGTILSAVATSFGWLLAGRALAGLGGAFIFAGCLAAAGDLFPDEVRRNRAIGFIWSAVTLASFLGVPVLAQLEAFVGWRIALISLLAPVLLGTLGTFWLPARTTERVSEGGEGWLTSYRRVLANRQVVWLVAAVVVVHLVWGGSFVFFGAYAVTRFGANVNALSALFLLGGGMEILTTFVVPALMRRFPAQRLFIALSLLGVVNFLAVEFANRWLWGLAPFVIIVSFVVTGLGLVTNFLLLDTMPEARGAAMALQSAAIEVGWGFGAVAAGVALSVGGYGAIYPTLGLLLPLTLLCIAGAARLPLGKTRSSLSDEAASHSLPLTPG
jgi:MFS transporter, DHA1 family, inner membrane transport protein